ncbi:MAG: MFS transporter [Candidatus Nanopelagicales bacterium]|nr:MFS transporter [Candidatus Nanopelagicales bacterium]
MNDGQGEIELPKTPRTPAEEAAERAKKTKKKRAKALTLSAITISVFLCWLGSMVFITSHDLMAVQLGTSKLDITLALASYSVLLIMIAIAGGRLCDIIGRKKMFIIAGLVFSLTSVCGVLIENVGSLLLVRALMGLCAGLILTSTGGILVTTMHGNTRHNGWLLWRGAGMCGMVLGPVFGPLVTNDVEWHTPFLANALLMLVAVALGAVGMKESRDEDSIFSFGLLAPTVLLGLGVLSPYLALLVFKEQIENWPLVGAIVVGGITCFVGYFVLNRRYSNKLFDANIVTHNRRMWLTDIFGAIHVGALFVVVATFTVILDADTNLTSTWIGIGMLPLVVPLITLHLSAHRFREKYGLTRQKETIIGCVLLTLSMIWWFAVSVRNPNYWTILPALILVGAGFGLIRLYGHMGVIKVTGQRWSSTLFGTRTFSNHLGATIGAIVIGYVLAAASIGTDTLDPAVARQAGLVVSLSILVVIVSSVVFAGLKAELLGLEDPHWHAAAPTGAGEAADGPVL